jgi:hypothetical protein
MSACSNHDPVIIFFVTVAIFCKRGDVELIIGYLEIFVLSIAVINIVTKIKKN